MKTHYQVLGVANDAPPEVVKAAYRVLAQQYHPDKNPGNQTAEDLFKSVNAAYQVVGDPEKRREYDVFLASRKPQAVPFPSPFTGFDPSGFVQAYPDAYKNVAGAVDLAAHQAMQAAGEVFVETILSTMPPHIREFAKQAMAAATKQARKKA